MQARCHHRRARFAGGASGCGSGGTQRSKCLGSTVARSQPLTVYIQPEDAGELDSKVDSSVADTEASQASTLLACLLLACRAFTLSSRHRRHPRKLVSTASESRAWSTSESGAPRLTADSRLLHRPTARRVECAYRRPRLGLHRGCQLVHAAVHGWHRIQARDHCNRDFAD